MKKTLLISLFSLSLLVVNSQEVFIFSPIIVADEDIENFEMIQKKYVTSMAQDAVKDKSIKQKHTFSTHSDIIKKTKTKTKNKTQKKKKKHKKNAPRRGAQMHQYFFLQPFPGQAGLLAYSVK